MRIVGDDGDAGPMVVMLHGYGAPGDDLVALARYLRAPAGTTMVFPEAPLSLGPALFGESRAWWHIDVEALERAIERGEERDQSETKPDGLPAARDLVVAMLSELDVGERPLVLGGFSQGAMLAMDVALRTDVPLAGLLQMSGTMLSQAEWTELAAGRAGLRVVQSHGRRDPLLPFSVAERLRDMLRAGGADVKWIEFDGGHEIPPPVLAAVGELLAAAT